jgi:hypothetical protein
MLWPAFNREASLAGYKLGVLTGCTFVEMATPLVPITFGTPLVGMNPARSWREGSHSFHPNSAFAALSAIRFVGFGSPAQPRQSVKKKDNIGHVVGGAAYIGRPRTIAYCWADYTHSVEARAAVGQHGIEFGAVTGIGDARFWVAVKMLWNTSNMSPGRRGKGRRASRKSPDLPARVPRLQDISDQIAIAAENPTGVRYGW